MSEVYYSGTLGEFYYDTNEFELVPKGHDDCPRDELKYIGYETDGSNIHIPEGITDCTSLFCSTDLKTPPIIPDGVTNCYAMFANCQYLEEAPVIPDSVVSCRSMFESCRFLKTAAQIPDNVTHTTRMYWNCKSLVDGGKLPKNVVSCHGMYGYCRQLKTAPVIPFGVKECNQMFLNCSELRVPPEIPESVTGAKSMFEGCFSLKYAPAIPNKNVLVQGMVSGCNNKVKKDFLWNLRHFGKCYNDEEEPDIVKWFPKEILGQTDMERYVVLVDIAAKYEESRHNQVYKNVIDGVNEGLFADLGEITSELAVADKFYSHKHFMNREVSAFTNISSNQIEHQGLGE